MLLDRLHDALLGLIALATLITLYGLLRPRRARVPDCPRCGYTHKMPQAEVCPECGFRPRAPQAWLGGRSRHPKWLRRAIRVTLAIGIPSILAIGILHGRWAKWLPNAALIESFAVMQLGTTTGQERVIGEFHKRRYSREQADRAVGIALDRFASWESQPVGAAPTSRDPNRFRAKLVDVATMLRLDDDGTVFSLLRPTMPNPAGRGAVHAEGAPYLAETSQPLTPRTIRTILDAVAGNGPESRHGYFIIMMLEDRARVMGPELLNLLGTNQSTSPPQDRSLARAILQDAPSIRRFLKTASPARRQQLIDIAFWEVYALRSDVLDVFHEFLKSPEAESLDTSRLLDNMMLQFPGGPEQWRARQPNDATGWSTQTRW